MTMPTSNGKDFTIGVLSVTAVVLFVGLVIVNHVSQRPAYASGQGGVTGDYVVSTARLDNTTEVLFVTDSVAQEMNMYAFIPVAGAIELVQKFDLRALDAINQPPKEVPDRGNRRGR
jgi:hypothetical protein